MNIHTHQQSPSAQKSVSPPPAAHRVNAPANDYRRSAPNSYLSAPGELRYTREWIRSGFRFC